eukprot:3398014-Amphidinium_carterae.1
MAIIPTTIESRASNVLSFKNGIVGQFCLNFAAQSMSKQARLAMVEEVRLATTLKRRNMKCFRKLAIVIVGPHA